MMTRFFYIIFLCVSIIGCSGVDPANEKAVRQPNVIFILADDLGYSELGAYGNSFNETPFVDSLASIGMKFTNAYAPAPVCSPYRAALMTGQHPARIGITDYLRPHGDEHLNEDLTTVAELFKQVGYTTGMIGKWHLSGYEKNGARESPPQNHGFDEVILNEQRGISGGSYFFPYHFNTEAKQKIFPVEFLTDRQNLEAVEFIRRNKDKPFFLYQSYYSVHTNLNGLSLFRLINSTASRFWRSVRNSTGKIFCFASVLK
ncbi:MAG: sulfatase-like hydrolase/transferase, partial [Marinoscillum sp.]